MKAFTAVLALLAAGTSLVSAIPLDSNASARASVNPRNPGISLARPPAIARRHVKSGINLEKRCKKRPSKSKPASSNPTSTSGSNPPVKTSSSADPDPPTSKPPTSSGGLLTGSSKCGGSGATKQITSLSGPNGDIDFFNCGIDGGGWNPPRITVDQVKTVDLSSAINQPGSPFKACAKYVGLFEQNAEQYGVPAIFLASFAMQESSCQASTIGMNNEQGLMQITKEKCAGAPGGNCLDPAFNIRTGASYFAGVLKESGGSVLLALGHYNGWFAGMTYADATRAAHQGRCFAQNNLDYMQQFLNGWCQNIDARAHHLGKYFNLNQCH